MTDPTSVVERRVVATSGGGTVTVFELGSGPILGVLHGTAGLDGPTAAMEDLAADHRVIAPCLPGFGSTPDEPSLRSIHDWVVVLSEISDAAGITGAPWLASSISAMLALELAAIRPEAFASLVAVGPTGLWDADDPGTDLYAVSLGEQASLLAQNTSTLGVLAGDPDGLDGDELIEVGVSRYIRRRTAASLVWPLPDHGLAGRLHRVSAPVTLVWGADDRLVPPSYGERFAGLLPEATLAAPIAGAAHLAELDAPAEVAAIVRLRAPAGS